LIGLDFATASERIAYNIWHIINLAVEIYRNKIWDVLAVENICAGLKTV